MLWREKMELKHACRWQVGRHKGPDQQMTVQLLPLVVNFCNSPGVNHGAIQRLANRVLLLGLTNSRTLQKQFTKLFPEASDVKTSLIGRWSMCENLHLVYQRDSCFDIKNWLRKSISSIDYGCSSGLYLKSLENFFLRI